MVYILYNSISINSINKYILTYGYGYYLLV